MYTGRSSQIRPRSSLLSQKHHRTEKISSRYTCQAVPAYGAVQSEVKATSHSTIFDIPMRPLREDQKH